MIEKEELQTLIPHRGKMFLLSRVLDFDMDDGNVTAEYDADADCLFYDAALGGIPAWFTFECMAQSISVLSGIRRRRQGLEPNIGMIMSVSNYTIDRPLVTSTITIEARRVMTIDTIYTFDCTVHDSGGEIARAKVTVLDVDDINTVIHHRGKIHES
jgi:predicted hotdog family 3-hydroxylacyl-ACP dehydratase